MGIAFNADTLPRERLLKKRSVTSSTPAIQFARRSSYAYMHGYVKQMGEETLAA